MSASAENRWSLLHIRVTHENGAAIIYPHVRDDKRYIYFVPEGLLGNPNGSAVMLGGVEDPEYFIKLFKKHGAYK